MAWRGIFWIAYYMIVTTIINIILIIKDGMKLNKLKKDKEKCKRELGKFLLVFFCGVNERMDQRIIKICGFENINDYIKRIYCKYAHNIIALIVMFVSWGFVGSYGYELANFIVEIIIIHFILIMINYIDFDTFYNYLNGQHYDVLYSNTLESISTQVTESQFATTYNDSTLEMEPKNTSTNSEMKYRNTDSTDIKSDADMNLIPKPTINNINQVCQHLHIHSVLKC